MHREVRRPCLTLALPQTRWCELKLSPHKPFLCYIVSFSILHSNEKGYGGPGKWPGGDHPFLTFPEARMGEQYSYTLSADPDQSVVQVPLCRRLSLTRCTGHSGTNEGFFSFTFKKRFFL